jgi:hypothetical protein
MLAWSLDSTNNSIEIAFTGSAPSPSGWVGWGINPNSLRMTGTQTFIAFTDATDGIGKLLTYDVTSSIKDGATFLPGPSISTF